MPTDAARLLFAARFAAERHRAQRRKDADATPYINHPLEVAELLATRGDVTDLAELQAALLHDTVEDTDTTPAELEELFGPAVRALVAEVTDDKSLPKAERKRLQVEHAPHLSAGAQRIKLADKGCNVRDLSRSVPADWTWQRCWDYLDWAERVVAGLRAASAELAAHFDDVLAEGRRRLRQQGGGA